MTNQKSLTISHVNVGYATGGKLSLISSLKELAPTIFQQRRQLDEPVCERQRETACVFIYIFIYVKRTIGVSVD